MRRNKAEMVARVTDRTGWYDDGNGDMHQHCPECRAKITSSVLAMDSRYSTKRTKARRVAMTEHLTEEH